MFSSRYRKHLDGAWPASGITHEDGQERYVYDAHGGGTRSKLTFIIYLKLKALLKTAQNNTIKHDISIL